MIKRNRLQRSKCPLYADYQDLYNQVELDAVVIALPIPLHWPATEAALAADIRNILLEKPIADSVEDAEKIIKACNDECKFIDRAPTSFIGNNVVFEEVY